MSIKKLILPLFFLFLPVTCHAEDDRACTKNSDCRQKEYCRFPVGDCGGMGLCITRGEVCPMDYEPVCACDDKTKSNECIARSEGLSIKYQGECKKIK